MDKTDRKNAGPALIVCQGSLVDLPNPSVLGGRGEWGGAPVEIVRIGLFLSQGARRGCAFCSFVLFPFAFWGGRRREGDWGAAL